MKRLAGVTWIMAVLVVSEMELSRLDTLQRIVERRLIRLPDDQAGLMGFGHQWKSTLP